MKNLKLNKKQIIFLSIFSLMIVIFIISVDIINFNGIKSFGIISVKKAIIFTLIVFIILLLLETVFDLNNKEKIEQLSKEIENIKNKLKKTKK